MRPRAVYNEMMQLLEEGLDDLSISRTTFSWGIPVPEGQGVIYVWFDALLNYISALGWPDGKDMRTFWPATGTVRLPAPPISIAIKACIT